MNEYNKILKKYFGYSSLKEEQYTVIDNIINKKRDVCAILATGFGKSICYQLPVLISKKSVIVICPLIALMKEQGDEMITKGIPVCVFNGDTSKEDIELYENELFAGEHKLIYMTPEYFIKSKKLVKKLEKVDNLCMICVDEAHAVSTWGLDFRPSYTQLNIIKEWVNVPILTLTATASAKVREDIQNILNMDNPLELIGNFDRPNLFIKILPKKNNIIDDISDLLKKYKDDYVIIYCKTRDETEKVAQLINAEGIECYAYHAGLKTSMRNDTQQNFNDGTYKCIVATIAFGMGINIPNVRLVIHYNCPKNIESYYQEIGRAGRDGKPSECYLFYSNKDFVVNRYFLKSIQNPVYKNYQEEQVRFIEKYIYTDECRRKIILKNFNQEVENCTNCDNCLRNKQDIKKVEYSRQLYLFLGLLKRINDKFGMTTIINILIGKGNIKDVLKTNVEFGEGINYGNLEWWKSFTRTLINEDLIKENQVTGFFGSTISLTTKGVKLINSLKNKYKNFEDLEKEKSNISDCYLSEIIFTKEIKKSKTTKDKIKVIKKTTVIKNKNIVIEED
jgi:Werner syndrome ATP-dependent helicase